jgi:hypothetical protein
MKKIILTVITFLVATSSFARGSNFRCKFSFEDELSPSLGLYQNIFQYSPGNLTDGPFGLVAFISDRFDDKKGEQVIFTNKNINGGTTINDFPKYSGFKKFCPTNVCRLLIDSPTSTGHLSAHATAMIQKKTVDGNFVNHKAVVCEYSFD